MAWGGAWHLLCQTLLLKRSLFQETFFKVIFSKSFFPETFFKVQRRAFFKVEVVLYCVSFYRYQCLALGVLSQKNLQISKIKKNQYNQKNQIPDIDSDPTFFKRQINIIFKFLIKLFNIENF